MNTKEQWEALLAHNLLTFRRINLEKIDATIASARGVIADWQVEEVAKARVRALALLSAGKFDAAMEAGQALFNAANGLHNALGPAASIGRKQRSSSEKGNRTKRENASAQYAEWQRRANAKWRQPEHANKSANEIARLIATPEEKPDTIRRRIKKLA